MRRFPLITILLLLPAVIISFWPAAASLLIFDRGRIVSGEIWRMVTGNWVHFSDDHLFYDLLGVGIPGALIEGQRQRGYGAFCLLAPAVIGVTVFYAQPRVELFGGLSGIATGSLVFLALNGLRQGGLWRHICLLALLAVTFKMGFELVSGQPVFVAKSTIEPLPLVHVAGALSAVSIWFTEQSRLRVADVLRRS